MRNIYIAAFTLLVALQQAINPVQLPIAESALAASQADSTPKQNYDLNVNANTYTFELKDTRPTFDTAVLAPLKAAQEAQAKAKADAEAAAQAAAEAASRVQVTYSAPKTAKLVIGGDDAWAQLRYCEAGGDYAKNTGNGCYKYKHPLKTPINSGSFGMCLCLKFIYICCTIAESKPEAN